jgi:hypothetical protein
MQDPQGFSYDIYEVDENAISQYNDLVSEQPELAINFEDLAISLGFDVPSSEFTQFLPVSNGPQDQSTGTHGSLNHAVTSTPHDSYSNAPIHDPKKACLICGKKFDRFGRARDHAYTHLGLRPYRCGGRCGDNGWYVYVTRCLSIGGTNVSGTANLLLGQKSVAMCTLFVMHRVHCGKWSNFFNKRQAINVRSGKVLTKKNMERHKQKPCPKRRSPSTSDQ